MRAHVTYSFDVPSVIEKLPSISEEIRRHFGIHIVVAFASNQGINMSVQGKTFTMEFYLDRQDKKYDELNDWSKGFANSLGSKFSVSISSSCKEVGT